MADPVADALAWLSADLLTAQRVLSRARLPHDIPTHVEVLTDILGDPRLTAEWRTEVALAVLTARDATH